MQKFLTYWGDSSSLSVTFRLKQPLCSSRRTTSEGGYFASLGNCLFNRVGKCVSVRTRKRRKIPLAFKLLFLLSFNCINSDQEQRPSASELLETDDFVKVSL